MTKKLTITVGIPTFLAEKHLVQTLNSIYNSQNIELIDHIIVAVDGKKIRKQIYSRIKHSKLTVISYKSRAGQSQRINNIVKLTKTDLLLLTNDDVVFSKDSISSLVEEYKRSRSSLISGGIYPMKPKTVLERILSASTDIKHRIIRSIPKNETYLTTNGRYICISKEIYKDLELPKNIINSDAYIYFYTVSKKLKKSYIDKIQCYYREPSTLSEHLNQVHKFQISFQENSKYFSQKFLKPKYFISKKLIAISNLKELLRNPIFVSLYVFVFLYARLMINLGLHKVMYSDYGYWETDISTKSI